MSLKICYWLSVTMLKMMYTLAASTLQLPASLSAIISNTSPLKYTDSHVAVPVISDKVVLQVPELCNHAGFHNYDCQ